jgi:hypothetical protein
VQAVGGSGGGVPELLAVRDLDLVRADRWPQVLGHLASTPALRRALVEQVAVVAPDGSRQHLTSYTAWWLRDALGLAGALDPSAAAPDAPAASGGADVGGLAELLDLAPDWVAGLDLGVRQALGLAGAGASPSTPGLVADAAVVRLLLTRLADPGRPLGVPACLAAWRVLASATADATDDDAAAPDAVRALVADTGASGGLVAAVVPADDAVVADDPRWLQRTDLGALVVAPSERAEALADLLDLDLASDVAAGQVTSSGVEADVPAAALELVRGNGSAGREPVTRWVEHDDLLVDGVPVDWWVADGVPHAATSEGLARALAWAAGAWHLRHALAALLTDPAAAARLMLEDAAG